MTGPASDAGLSTWWPTPVRATDHFSVDELQRSADLHRPLRRVRQELVATRVVVLAAAAILLGFDEIGGRLDQVAPAGRAIVAGAAVVTAVRSSEALATWHLARLDGVEAVPLDRVAGGGAVAAHLTRFAGAVVVPILVLAVIARFGLALLADPTSGWLVAVGLAVVATAVTVVASRVRAARAAPVDAPQAWADLVDRAGCRGRVTFGLLVEEGGDRPGLGPAGADDEPPRGGGPNACAIGAGSRRWVLVDERLVDERLTDEPNPAATFILAHEVTHLARRHPEVQIALHLVTTLAGLGAVPLAASWGWPGEIVGLAPDDPRSLPVAALLVLAGVAAARIPATWVLRALERSADAGAVDLVEVPDRSAMRVLHLQAGGELAPPRWSQLLAVRPSPAERLEYLARCRRSIRPGSTPARRPDPDPHLLR